MVSSSISAKTTEASVFSINSFSVLTSIDYKFYFYSLYFVLATGYEGRMWLGMRVHYQITLLTRSNTLNRGPWGTVDLPSSGRPLGTGQSTPHLVTEPFLSRTPLQKCCNIFCPSSENIIRDVYLVDM